MARPRSDASPVSRPGRAWTCAAVMVAVGFALYWNTLPAPFVFDDEQAIVVNARIRHVSTSLSGAAQGSPLAGRPLVSATFAVNYALGGLNVRGYRLVNIALHLVCGLLLFACVRAALTASETGGLIAPHHRPDNVALAAALIWMVHPLVTEAVNYISQRTELMMAAFLLLTFAAAQRAARSKHEKPWLAASVSCCALGMACKETMALAPLIVVLYDRTFAFGSFGNAMRRRWPYYTGLCATWLVLVALLWSSPRGDSAGFSGASVSPWEYLLNQSVMIARYARLAIWPNGLVLDYGTPQHLTLTAVAPEMALVAGLLAVTVVMLVRRPTLGFLGAWCFLTLAPTSSIIPISTEVGAERRMYVPLMAVVVLVVTMAGRAVTARPSAARSAPHGGAPHIAVVLTAFVVALLGAATFQRNAEYRSGLTLWQSVLDRWPPHARAHRNLAAELKLVGRTDEEIAHLRTAVNDLPDIRNLLGLELLAAGRTEEGASELGRFILERPSDPSVPDARVALGAVRLAQRDYEAARGQYAELVTSRPTDSDALSNLGIALAALGRRDEATRAFERAVDVDPGNGLSQRNLALHLFEQNDFEGAVRHARDAVRLTPSDPPAHNLLGLALVGQGKTSEAIGEFRTSLALQPINNDAASYLERTLAVANR